MNALTKKQYKKQPGAVLYVRVSTEDQAEHGTSPETQREGCLRLAEQAGLPVAAVCEDLGVSGTRYATRPGIQEALRLIESGQADTLIATKVDRIGRSAVVILDIARRVRAAGASLVTGDQRFDDTPQGQFTLTMFAAMAELERNTIRERTMKGKRKRAEEGQQPQRSTPAYGYHIVTNAQVECGLYPPEMRGRYVIIEEEAEIVRDLFARYAAGGVGFPPLARDLNARHIPASRGGLWHPVCVSIILRNPVYKGQPAYGRVSRSLGEAGPRDRHSLTGAPLLRPRAVEKAGEPTPLAAPPLVSEELWERAQARLTTNRMQQGGNPRRARMLSGRAFCPCGHSAALVGKPGAKYYQCARTVTGKRLHGEAGCQRAAYALKLVEQSVIVSLLDAAARPEALAAAVQAYQQERNTIREATDPAGLRRERAALENALKQVERDEAAAVQAQVAGILAGASPAAYGAVFADIAARRKDLEGRRGAVARLLAAPGKGGGRKAEGEQDRRAGEALRDIARVLSSDAVPGQEKRDLVGSVIARVVCRPDGADVFFLPGLGAAQGRGPSDGPGAYDGSETCNSTLTELMQ
jgi:site-specific DNA recombinase